MKRDLSNRRAIITGASSGIGRETALALAANGVSVVVVARREDRLRQLVEGITALGQKAEAVVGDITDPETRRRAVDTAQSKLGGLDILVNNAGVGALGLFEDADPQRVRRVMEVNFFALVEMTRLALPLLKQGVKSDRGQRQFDRRAPRRPHRSEYSASKFAVQGFSEAIRAEFARLGIDVLVVSPGTTETEFFDRELQQHRGAQWPEHKPVSARRGGPKRSFAAIRRGRHEIIPSVGAAVPLLAQSPLAAAGRQDDGPVHVGGHGIRDSTILYEEGPCLVVCKPPGLPTQAPPGIDSLEVRVKAFLQRARRSAVRRLSRAFRTGSIGRRPGRWSLPPASARTRKLARQFERREVKKLYWACVAGRPDPPARHMAGLSAKGLRQAAGRSRAGRSPRSPAGRAALSDARPRRDWGAWLEIELETGRTHQVRIQAASRGHPVLGDFQYGSKAPFGPQHDDERLRAIALHARTLAFRHPTSKQRVSVTAPPPEFWPPDSNNRLRLRSVWG